MHKLNALLSNNYTVCKAPSTRETFAFYSGMFSHLNRSDYTCTYIVCYDFLGWKIYPPIERTDAGRSKKWAN